MPASRQILARENFQRKKCSQRKKDLPYFCNYSADVQKIIIDKNNVKKAERNDNPLDSKSRLTYVNIGKTQKAVLRFCADTSTTNGIKSPDDNGFFDSGEWVNYQNDACRNGKEHERESHFIESGINSRIAKDDNVEQKPLDSAISKSQYLPALFLEDLSAIDSSGHSFQKCKNAGQDNISENYFNDQKHRLNDEYDNKNKGKHISKNGKHFRRQEIKRKISKRHLRNQNEYVDDPVQDWDKITQVKFSCHGKVIDEHFKKELKNFAMSLKDPLEIQAKSSARMHTVYKDSDGCNYEKFSQDIGESTSCNNFSEGHKNNDSVEKHRRTKLVNKNEFFNDKYKRSTAVQCKQNDTYLDDPLKMELKKFAKSLKDPNIDKRSLTFNKCNNGNDFEKGKPTPIRKRNPSFNPDRLAQEESDSVCQNVHRIHLDEECAQHRYSPGHGRRNTEFSPQEDERLKTELINVSKSVNNRYINKQSKIAEKTEKNGQNIIPCSSFESSHKDVKLNSVNQHTHDTVTFQSEKGDTFSQKSSRHIPHKEHKKRNPLNSDVNLKADLRNFIKEICPNKLESTKSKQSRSVSNKEQDGVIHHYADHEAGDSSAINCKTNSLRRGVVQCCSNEVTSKTINKQTNDIQTGYNFNQTNNLRNRRNRRKHCLPNISDFSDLKSVKQSPEGDFSLSKNEFDFGQSVIQPETGEEQSSGTRSYHLNESDGLFDDGCSSSLVKTDIRRKKNGKMSNIIETDCSKNNKNDLISKWNEKFDSSVASRDSNEEPAISANLAVDISYLNNRLSSTAELESKNDIKNEIINKDENNGLNRKSECGNNTTDFLPRTPRKAKHGRRSEKSTEATESEDNKKENSLAVDNFNTNSSKDCNIPEKPRSSVEESLDISLPNKKIQGCPPEANNIHDNKLNSNETLQNSEESSNIKQPDLGNSGIKINHEKGSKLVSINPGNGENQNHGYAVSRQTCEEIQEESPEEHSKSTISAFLDSQQYSDCEKRDDVEESISDKVRRWEKGCCQDEKAGSVASSNSSKELLKKFNLGSAMASTLYGSPKKNCDSSKKQGNESNQPTKDAILPNEIHHRRQWDKPPNNEQNVHQPNTLEGHNNFLSSNCGREIQQIFLGDRDIGQDSNYINSIHRVKQDNIKIISGPIQTNLNQLLSNNNQTGYNGDMLNFNIQHPTCDSSGNFSNIYSKIPIVLNYIHPLGVVHPNAFIPFIDCNTTSDPQNNKLVNFESEKANVTTVQDANNESLKSVDGIENGCHLVKTDDNIDQKSNIHKNVDRNTKDDQMPQILSQNGTTDDSNCLLNKDVQEKDKGSFDMKDQINQSRKIIRDKLISGRNMASVMYGDDWENKSLKTETTNGQAFRSSAVRNDKQSLKNDNSNNAVDNINAEFLSTGTTITKTVSKDVTRKPKGIVPGLEDTDTG
ncbi:hypothetical protein HNY73_017869 [Argiope bruennichi]|uniref:Uncharacterized protein n=1 Tax=Argiope bruennichi TaxID=94029 RepID=A0A8T0EF43_ARGBR|nr:hypothetical protein HNY73_017869 [Argiope bruennichi]